MYPTRSAAASPFVSVHVATCNEPPTMVMETLRALEASDYAAFEVIVVDNNTSDPALWRPVEEGAAHLGERYRFAHFDHLGGAKAGALNIALSMTDPRAEYIAIVDADYQVDPAFLAEATNAAKDSAVDYVQFPQAYRGVGVSAKGVELELADYFACFAGRAGAPDSMLPTGTLSLFRTDALRAVGGWPLGTITEDAEIGVRLQAAGYCGLWLARPGGRGLLPVDFEGIRKQRARWAAGNLQVLTRLHQADWRRLTGHDLLNLITQLTAWISLTMPAAVALIAVGISPQSPDARLVAAVAASVILGSAMLIGGRLMFLNGAGVAVQVRLGAIATKLALSWTSAVAWAPALLGRPLIFHRTAKSIQRSKRGAMIAELAASAAFLTLGLVYGLRQQVLPVLACLMLALVWPCALAVDGSLRRAASLQAERS